MSSDGSSWVPTQRQYRPSYTNLPSSASVSNFGSPLPRATTQPALNTKRRRTTSNFPTIEHLHSAPTVASSGLTASVFSNDISNPTPKSRRLSIYSRTRTPTRIPTPVPHIKVFSPVRSVSSPAAPQKTKDVQCHPDQLQVVQLTPGARICCQQLIVFLGLFRQAHLRTAP